MFHLWIGIMSGVLLTYLWVHDGTRQNPRTPPVAQVPNTRRLNTLLRRLFAISALTTLSITFGWEFMRFGSGRLGIMEGVKVVLLPWAAGVGFGVWAYLIVTPLPANGVENAPPDRKKNGQANNAADDQASAPERWTPTFTPLLLALLFVMIIVTEERYGWFERLQKVTIGGSGFELTPRTSEPSAIGYEASRAAGLSFPSTGADRIAILTGWMSNWDQFVHVDRAYAHETGHRNGWPERHFEADLKFALDVIVPLGRRLDAIHQARKYNDIYSIIHDRTFVDDFRAFTHARTGDPASSPTIGARGAGYKIRDGLRTIWLTVCAIDADLRHNGQITDAEGSSASCEGELRSADASIDGLANEQASDAALSRKLPYGTIMSALLLNAAGEFHAAVNDLDDWASNDPDRGSYRRIGIYRVLHANTFLYTSDPSAKWTSGWAERFARTVETGDKLIAAQHSYAGRRPWREQNDIFSKPPNWGQLLSPTTACSNDLSLPFKRLALANLSATNSFIYYLSQNYALTEWLNKVQWMTKEADLLAKLDLRCLEHRDTDEVHDKLSPRMRAEELAKTRASYLDTVAAVKYTLAEREDRRGEKKALLCESVSHARDGAAIYRDTTRKEQKNAQWNARRSAALAWEEDRIDTALAYARREESARSALKRAGLECP